MSNDRPIVFVVDDDPSVREALSSLIRSVGLRVEAFPSAADFLQHDRPEAPACLVLDVRMPGLSGMDLQRQLAEAADRIPIIFVTGHGDIPMTVRAMKNGAIDFLTKPFSDESLLDAIQQALAKDRQSREVLAESGQLIERYQSLTAREREVMPRIVHGMLNKQAAAELGISEVTVKVHRHNIMHKMGARSLPELVRMFEKIRAWEAVRTPPDE